MTTTPKQVHRYFSGPWMELAIEPNILVIVGRSREMEDYVTVATGTFDGELTSFVTIPKDEFIRALDVARTLL